MFTSPDKRMDFGEPGCTRGSGEAQFTRATDHSSLVWPCVLVLFSIPALPLLTPRICKTQLRKEHHPSLYVFSHMLVICGGLSQLLLCHLDCKEIKREDQDKRHAPTDISGIQNSWLHCIWTIVLLNVNHSVYFSYYSFTSYKRLDPSTAEVFPLTLLEWDQVLSATLAGCFHVQF